MIIKTFATKLKNKLQVEREIIKIMNDRLAATSSAAIPATLILIAFCMISVAIVYYSGFFGATVFGILAPICVVTLVENKEAQEIFHNKTKDILKRGQP